ncbi:SCO family protein [Pseudoduganella sp. FT25W]|uniref:SCO family protein n=1 Tax=Duganella alba TaxID=2666081 RepID=A0A6L5QKC8_9BURK|nr:SCO family protein [Duganella alba]MRX10140.1 SCO family protein [Duganella alba]MRX16672.1 SCO family protein [Duganella alba]
MKSFAIVCIAALFAWSAPAAAAPVIPTNSIYQLTTPMTDAAGQRFTLHDMSGAPLLVTMFYGDCHSACPVVIETLKRTVAALGPDGKRLRILLISLDPKRDTPQSLAMMAQMQHLDPMQYRLAVAHDDSDTRMLASTLNIRFRALDDGEINHTTRIALLDAAGAMQADSTRLDVEPDPAFIKRIRQALKR